MGPESKKSKNLLLLQLAANLVTGRTDQPGFKGFIDVLGQAGKATTVRPAGFGKSQRPRLARSEKSQQPGRPDSESA